MNEANALRIWVVDDDESIRWVMERSLGRHGMAVTCFPGAAEMLDALAESTPDVLISDIRMPGVDGLELLSRLHEKDLIGFFPDYISEKERRLQERVQAIRENLDDVVVLPYNREQWDESRTVMERVDDWVRPDKAKEATEYVAA